MKKKLKRTQSRHRGKKKALAPGRIFVYALALAALGGSGFLLYDYIRARKRVGSNDTLVSADVVPIVTVDTTSRTPSAAFRSSTAKARTKSSDNFPLKKGSRGPRVVALQQALINKGARIQADGKLGPATLAAMAAAGYGSTVDEGAFSKLTAQPGSVQVLFNPADLARRLYLAANRASLEDTLAILAQIKSVADYTAVNEYYKKHGLVSSTIVTDLLDSAFDNQEEAKDQIRQEFARIGLKVNEQGVWSLQGIQLYKDLVTLRKTIVIDIKNNRIPVAKNIILGDEVKIENGMTWFRSIDRSILKVPTQDVTYSN